MTDWLYEASNAQANLDSTRRELSTALETISKYQHVLHLIATDYIELSHDKIRWQRDYYRKISRKTLGYDDDTQPPKGKKNVKLDDDF